MKVNRIGISGEMDVPQFQYTEKQNLNVNNNENIIKKIDNNKNNNNEEITKEKIDNEIKKINSNAEIMNNGIKFEKDEETSKWVVKVINEKTGEVIRQIPAKEFLAIAKSIEMALGNIFNKEV